MKSPVLGFIGFGHMASILVEAALESGIVKPKDILFNRKDIRKAEETKRELGIGFSSIETIVKQSDYIFLAIKPQQFSEILEFVRPFLHKKSIIVSIMAGVSLTSLKEAFGAISIARVMPNTPSQLGEGATALSFNEIIQRPQKAFIHSFFQSVGKVVEIPESAQSAATAISGCGPAFYYTLADAVCEEGITNGLTYEQALTLCAQTLIGAGHMLLESQKTPSELVREVASPNGATEAGLNCLKSLNLESLFRDVIKASIKRSVQLGQLKETT